MLGILLLAIIALTHAYLRDDYLQIQASKQRERVEVFRSALFAKLSRHDYLPQVLSENDELFNKAYQSPKEASQTLESIRSASQADVVFILSPDGTTIASSNWQDGKKSFVGKNYGFRPYFTEALSQGSGVFFGIGATTGVPGYYVSASYLETGRVIAVTTVKVNSSSLGSL